MNKYDFQMDNQVRVQMNSMQFNDRSCFNEYFQAEITLQNKIFQNKQFISSQEIDRSCYQPIGQVKQVGKLDSKQKQEEHEQEQLHGQQTCFLTPKKEVFKINKLQNQVEVEIKQLFTNDHDEKFTIYQIFSCYSEKGKEKQFQSTVKPRKGQNNNLNKIIELRDNDILQNELYNVDQYFNFETPKKFQQEFLDEDNLNQELIQCQQNNHRISKVEQNEIRQIFEQQNKILINQIAEVNEEENGSKTTVKKIYKLDQVGEDYTLEKKVVQNRIFYKKNQSHPQSSTTNFFKNSNESMLNQSTKKHRLDIINKKIKKKLDFQKNQDIKSYKRGPYQSYSEKLKKKAINDYFRLKDIKLAAQINQVKTKNLKRWIAVGYKRKEGGGRKKEDPQMEDQVYKWLKDKYYNEQAYVSRNQIREKALELSNKKDKFKASKGWLEKFFARYNCKFMCKKEAISDKQNEQKQE
ncbi:Tc5 transposase DNA-binding domain protein (macronuclear) [Tetrahymena thermophila SB210]|uniref:Tc5 transposase DNA-binding domain protein n=1 Tax=Tetrahymena thermophila (strain SB210) TaxID=312017 RepID=Q24FR6_TETTS|nr:Tc5 transposase DNA-binding domain protein [Tetrahymena thermophila SB210]EAS06629.3 Tc5 transposase DNA-binding domain protein [Tetrahymena thermophila SB210]|eukprot:XP_001026874.3 Tc5 transposase DNA-binding domain protein [Tetrahymena thermophila SB210]